MKTFDTASAPHLPAKRSVRGVMGLVLAALLPGIVAHAWFFGLDRHPDRAGHRLRAGLRGGDAAAARQADAALPHRPQRAAHGGAVRAVRSSVAPWWIAAIGMASAIVLRKHLYGGLGHNLFNPAMVGVAVVLLCFPREFTQWLPPAGVAEGVAMPGFIDSLRAVFTGELPAPWRWDALAQATPLDTVRTLGNAGATLAEIRDAPLFGDFGGRGWEWVANFFALGGLFLLWKKVIPWQVPVATLGTVVLVTLPFWDAGPGDPFPLQHALRRAGAGRVLHRHRPGERLHHAARPLFGAGVALLTLAIRRWGAFPDGVAFAVLLMNCLGAWLDLHTRPRILGEGRPR